VPKSYFEIASNYSALHYLISEELVKITNKKSIKNAKHKLINPRRFNLAPVFSIHRKVYKLAIGYFSGRSN